ncbi:unnamed protein product [Natator depressus]
MTGAGITWRLRRQCTQEDEGSLQAVDDDDCWADLEETKAPCAAQNKELGDGFKAAGLLLHKFNCKDFDIHVQRWECCIIIGVEATRPFDSLLNSSPLRAGASEGEVASAVTLLMQAVKKAMLATELQSPEMKTQNGRTGSIAGGVLRLACHWELQCRQRDLRLRAQEETMDIPCDTVTMATTQGFQMVVLLLPPTDTRTDFSHPTSPGAPNSSYMETNHHQTAHQVPLAPTIGFTAVACITYSTPDSIINKTFLSEGNLPAGEKLRNVQLNSRVENSPLTIVSYVGLTLSLLCLLLTILTFLMCRSIHNVMWQSSDLVSVGPVLPGRLR